MLVQHRMRRSESTLRNNGLHILKHHPEMNVEVTLSYLNLNAEAKVREAAGPKSNKHNYTSVTLTIAGLHKMSIQFTYVLSNRTQIILKCIKWDSMFMLDLIRCEMYFVDFGTFVFDFFSAMF